MTSLASVCPSHIFRFFSLSVSAPKAVTSSDFVWTFSEITVKMSSCCGAILTVVLVSWLLSSCLCEKGIVVSFSFQTPAGCPGELARESPVSEVVTSPSVISCSALCASSPDCQAITFDPDSRTCQLFPQSENCTGVKKAAEMMNYFVKEPQCQNGGTLQGRKCECPPGYIGQTCELGPMRDCFDYKMNGWLQSSGVHVIRPTDAVSFPVFCVAEGFVVFLRRLNNRVNFTRPWRDYRDGFGDISGSHWLGLEKTHILTSQDRVYQLHVQIALTNGTNLYSFYNNFTVRDKSQFYQFDFTVNAMGNDCLSDLRGANFSTYDSDNDGDSSVNCASRHSGGWWFRGNTCSTCNPTGQLLQPANGLRTGVDSEVFWIKDLGNVVPFRIRFSLANM